LEACGIKPLRHDLRFVEDDWESPTLGAWGLGWEVWLDSLEITQFTYFQQCGGIDLDPISCEITYGLERIAMFLQGKDSVFDIEWNEDISYGDIHLEGEKEFSRFNFELAPIENYQRSFKDSCALGHSLLQQGAVLPAYDQCLKASHDFNILDARGAISVNQRPRIIGEVRALARACAEGYLARRKELHFPLSR